MSRAAPLITKVESAVYRIPTDGAEADGTIAWDHTTLVVVRVHAGGERGLGYTYGSGACATLVDETLAGLILAHRGCA